MIKHTRQRRFDDNEKKTIFNMFLKNYTYRTIAEVLHCSPASIQYQLSKKGFARKLSNGNIEKIMKFSKFTERDIVNIRKKYSEGITVSELMKKYKASQTAILRICCGVSYFWIKGKIKKYRHSIPRENKIKIFKPKQLINIHGENQRFGVKKGTKRRFKRGFIKKIAQKMNLSSSCVVRLISKNKLPKKIKKEVELELKKN